MSAVAELPAVESPRIRAKRVVAARAPGASNTRRNTPPEAGGGGAEADDLRHLGPARVLCTRVDALYLAFQGDLKADVRRVLGERLADAKALGTAVAVPFDDVVLVLDPRSREGWWKLSNWNVSVKIDEGPHLGGWSLEVSTSAKMLATAGPREALALSRRIADLVLHVANGERVRRFDLCADVVGLDLGSIDVRAWVTPRRSRVDTFGTMGTPYKAHDKGDRRTGFQIGHGDVVGRVYDKPAELAAKRDDEKREIEHARWRAAGWCAGEDVTRVEFQLRGEALKEVDGGLRDPDTMLSRVDAVWAYCTRRWLRLIEHERSTRRYRCPSDERWTVLQSARFGAWDGEVPGRTRRRGLAMGRLALGAAINYAASIGVLEATRVDNGQQHVAAWSEERCAAFVFASVARVLRGNEESIARDLIEAKGTREAAAFVIEKMGAALARTVRSGAPSRG